MRADLAQTREAIRRFRKIRDSGKVEAVLRGEFQSRLRLIFPAPDDEAWINRKASGDSGGFEFRAFLDFFDAYEQVLREGCFTPSRVSTMMPISFHPIPVQ